MHVLHTGSSNRHVQCSDCRQRAQTPRRLSSPSLALQSCILSYDSTMYPNTPRGRCKNQNRGVVVSGVCVCGYVTLRSCSWLCTITCSSTQPIVCIETRCCCVMLTLCCDAVAVQLLLQWHPVRLRRPGVWLFGHCVKALQLYCRMTCIFYLTLHVLRINLAITGVADGVEDKKRY